MEIDGETTGFTTITILFVVELFGTAHDELDVTTHQMVSLLFNPELLKVAAFPPIFPLFNFH